MHIYLQLLHFFQGRFLDHRAINVFLLLQSLFYSWFGLIWVWQPQISFPFAWNIFFHPLTFSLHVSLDLRWISYKTAYMWFLFLYPFSHLIFFIGAFISVFIGLLISKIIINSEDNGTSSKKQKLNRKRTQHHLLLCLGTTYYCVWASPTVVSGAGCYVLHSYYSCLGILSRAYGEEKTMQAEQSLRAESKSMGEIKKNKVQI